MNFHRKILNILLAHWIEQQIKKITPWPSKILYLGYKFVKHMTINASYHSSQMEDKIYTIT